MPSTTSATALVPTAHDGAPLFRSFWMGGYEGADHINSRGVPLDLHHSNGHRDAVEQDYARLAEFGIRTIRESIGWRASTMADGTPDLRHLKRMAEAAQRFGIQVIWTIHHYGLPPAVDFFSENFAAQFADFCHEVARTLRGTSDGPTVYQPINEISFLSWAAGQTDLIHPYRGGIPERGYELKCRLVRATLQGCDALWATEPGARIVHTDPLIHVIPADPHDEAVQAEARALNESQYQAWDMLRGDLEPGLGGAPRYLDILGLNYYHSNQWEHPSHERLYWHLGDSRRRDLDALLEDVWQRYRRPLFIAETGHVGDGRGLWLDEVASAALRCAERGVPLEGLCLYPLVDRPDWEDPSRWHCSGLWDVPRSARLRPAEAASDAGRVLHEPYARRLRYWQAVLPAAPAMVSNTGAIAPVAPVPPVPPTDFSAQSAPPPTPHAALAHASCFSGFPSRHFPESHPMTPTTLIVFSHLRWDFVYQRPQQILSRLAARFPVVFVEEPIPNAARPALERLQPCAGVEVLRPHLPGASYGFHDEHLAELRHLLAGYLQTHAVGDYWLWFYTPMALPLAADLEPEGVIYDCMDELSAFRNAPPQMLEREAALLEMADLVFTGGHSLYEAKRDRHDNVHCFPSSVDAAHYARAAHGEVDDSAQAHIPHPRLGYFGVIDERIDIDLVAALADAHAEWQIVMVGPVVKVDPADLPQRSNIHWLGKREYDELPDLIAGWDVCLMPFAMNESTRFISPTKTLEYLAAGKAVVSTPIRDVVTPYSGIVAIAEHAGEFIAACEDALDRSPQECAEHMAAAEQMLAGTSWDDTAAAMADLIAPPSADESAAEAVRRAAAVSAESAVV